MFRILLLTIVLGMLLTIASGQIIDRKSATGLTLQRSFPRPTIRPHEVIMRVPEAQEFRTKEISSAHAIRHLPFFCRQELALEKRLRMPIRLRIGSVQQADWLEGKSGAARPGR